jgi:putative transposase
MHRMNTRDRRSIRLPNYDYTSVGSYFVTIRASANGPALSVIKEAGLLLTKPGEIVCDTWLDLPVRFPSLQLDMFSVQPDHVHGILRLSERNASSLGEVIRAFKSVCAIAINRSLGKSGSPVWQRNYYERVIRNERELEQVRQYIEYNHRKTPGKQRPYRVFVRRRPRSAAFHWLCSRDPSIRQPWRQRKN